MIDQLWYTWSSTGLSGNVGFQVRAASEGLRNLNSERFMALDAHTRYSLPADADRFAATRETSPCSLAFIDVNTGMGIERVLVHKVYIGRDAYGRPGVYFTHLLVGLPESFVARDAIDLWDSPFWKTADDSSPTYLPTIAETELEEGSLHEDDLLEVRHYLPFVIQAYLSLQMQQKLYIAAPDLQVARLIWGLTRALPRTMQQDLTFSTYERDGSKSPARIVGTCHASVLAQDTRGVGDVLPQDAYTSHLMLDCYANRPSGLAQDTPGSVYAQFASQRLLSSEHRYEFAEFLQKAERLQVSDTGSLLALYRFVQADAEQNPLTEEEINGLLGNSALAAEFLGVETVQIAIIDLAAHTPDWWQGVGAPALLALRSPQNNAFGASAIPAVTDFVNYVPKRIVIVAQQKEWDIFKTCFTIMNDTATPARSYPEVWANLLRHFASAQANDPSFNPLPYFSWDSRGWLLEKWSYSAEVIPDNIIRPWLQVSWEELQHLLNLGIAEKWKILVILDLLTSTQGHIPHENLYQLSRYDSLFRSAVAQLLQNPQAQFYAQQLVQSAANADTTSKLPILSILLTSRSSSLLDMDEMIRGVRLSTNEKVMVIKQYSQQLFSNGISPIVADLISTYIQNVKVYDFRHEEEINRLDLLWEKQRLLPKNTQGLVNAWHVVCRSVMLQDGVSYYPLTTQAEELRKMAEAIKYLKLGEQQTYRNELFSVIVNTLRGNRDKRSIKSIKDELESVIEILAPAVADSRETMLKELSAKLGELNPQNQSYQLIPYIWLAFEYAHPLVPKQKEAFLGPLMRALLKNASSQVYADIDASSEKWTSKDKREAWNTWSKATRPTKIMDRVKGIKGKFRQLQFMTGKQQLGATEATSQTAGSTSNDARSTPSMGAEVYNAAPTRPAGAGTIAQFSGQQLASDDIAVVIKNQQSRPISREWFGKVHRVRKLYVSYRIEELNMEYKRLLDSKEAKKNPSISQQGAKVTDEMAQWKEQLLADVRKVVQHELAQVILINDYIAQRYEAKNLNKNEREKIVDMRRHKEKAVADIIKWGKNYDKSKKQDDRQGFISLGMQEQEIKTALEVFVLRELFKLYLDYANDSEYEQFLRNLEGQAVCIYSTDLPSFSQ